MSRRRKGRLLDGWIVVDKGAGMTSARVVSEVRRLTGAAKAGHAGTLDPMATGILPVALGEATKTASHLMDGTKVYVFEARWGEERDTDDLEGTVVARSDHRPSEGEIRAALAEFTGRIEQVPPAYSAIKVGGERAYKLAREGRPVNLARRTVEVQRFELIDCPDPDAARFEVACGRGTYVRALVRDLGHRLGTRGYVAALRRTRVGRFGEKDAISLETLADLVHSARLSAYLHPVETALADIPALALTEPQAIRLKNGEAVRVLNVADGAVCAMAGGRPVALAEVQHGEVRPLRVFNL